MANIIIFILYYFCDGKYTPLLNYTHSVLKDDVFFFFLTQGNANWSVTVDSSKILAVFVHFSYA